MSHDCIQFNTCICFYKVCSVEGSCIRSKDIPSKLLYVFNSCTPPSPCSRTVSVYVCIYIELMMVLTYRAVSYHITF